MSVHSSHNVQAKDCCEDASSRTITAIRTLSLKDYLCPESRPQFLSEMRDSLMEIGTFYIKDHGVPTEVTDGAMKAIQDYFALPLEEKSKMHIRNSQHFRGYKLMGEEMTNNQIDHREQLQFAPEQTVESSFVPTTSRHWEGLHGPNQWPLDILALVPEFKSSVLQFMDQLEILSQHLMEAVALSLNLEATYFRELFGSSPYYRLKCAKYPSVEKADTIGCGAHKDTGFLTVLLQDMVGGLQGQDPVTGQWLDTCPVPETFIVTMGEAIEKLTGGLYHATVHRVLNNTSGQNRYSIPFFFDPSLSSKIPHRIPALASLRRSVSSTSSMSMSMSMPMSTSASSLTSLSDEESCSEDELDHMMDALKIHHGKDDALSSQDVEGWSNGDHIFETVQRCHPEVFSRWYGREL
ncbi:hypothetical protein BGZ65_004769 [Modicella reniformis]|uniref:Fe2OG dioxygenase domain-containing protein n=1 Tax=Modicella reniformis TaxID=1440133 RepID=A0A9P6IL76_9FUNG|nr:hypothetical protein BGZ65_004769 [Modicella reniformis]